MNNLLLIANPKRKHKILPLLDGFNVETVDTFNGLLRLFNGKNRPLFVLVDTCGRWALLALLASLLLRAPIVYRLRGDFFREEILRRKYVYNHLAWFRYFFCITIARITLKYCRGIIFNSEYIKKVTSLKINEKITCIIYNPFTPLKKTSSYQSALSTDRTFKILSVTNMNLPTKITYCVDKILTIPLEKWEALNLVWYICGDGALRDTMINRIQKAGLQNRVIFTGRINDIERYYQACHVFIHLTKMDAFPNATLEAMFYHKPVITNSDSCGTREQIFHMINGLIIDDKQELIKAIEYYYYNQNKRKKHGCSGNNIVVKKFSINKQRQLMVEYIKQFQDSFS